MSAAGSTAGPAGNADLIAAGWRALRVEGSLGRSRDLFEHVAQETAVTPESTAFAEAVLGASGLWLHEQRSPVDQARIATWRQSALTAADPSSLLAARLRMRESAEADYAAGGTALVLAALDDVMRSGDGSAVVEGLHLTQHCLLGPEYGELRMALTSRLLSTAATTGDPFDISVSLLWRVTNLLLLADPHADRALSSFRAALQRHPHQAFAYVLSAIDVMMAIRAGDLQRAEALAEQSATQGREAGDPDFVGWYGAHLVTIRYFQGRGHELMPMLQELVASPDLSEPNDAFLGALATAASMTGDTWTAATALSRLRRPSLATLRHNSLWLVTLFGAVLAADLLQDTDIADEAYELLLPHAELPTAASFAITCMGSTHYPLGVAASTSGRWEQAVEHFAQAITANQALGHRPARVLSEAALARALVRVHDHPGADRHLRRARAEATELGMTPWLAEWGRSDTATAPLVECARDGERWVLTTPGHRVRLDDSLGMQYLAELVTHPDTEITALELTNRQAGSVAPDSTHQLLDAQARQAYRARVAELEERLELADLEGDPVASEAARTELDWLVAELGRATGLAGRDRGFPHDAERARTSVQKAIRRALARISTADATIGALLTNAITTGYRCSYRPPAV
jgi:tetratricopeptide (TPR) repeat protein